MAETKIKDLKKLTLFFMNYTHFKGIMYDLSPARRRGKWVKKKSPKCCHFKFQTVINSNRSCMKMFQKFEIPDVTTVKIDNNIE